jgi:hypothetical protein
MEKPLKQNKKRKGKRAARRATKTFIAYSIPVGISMMCCAGVSNARALILSYGFIASKTPPGGTSKIT